MEHSLRKEFAPRRANSFLKELDPIKKWVGWLVVLLFYVHGKHLRSYRDGQLT